MLCHNLSILTFKALRSKQELKVSSCFDTLNSLLLCHRNRDPCLLNLGGFLFRLTSDNHLPLGVGLVAVMERVKWDENQKRILLITGLCAYALIEESVRLNFRTTLFF